MWSGANRFNKKQIQKRIKNLAHRPSFTLFLEFDQSNESSIVPTVESVIAQLFPDWILIIKNRQKLNPDDLEKILAFVDKLNEIDTEGVEPLIYMSDEVNVLRADEISEETAQDEALKNAPQKDSDYFKVPTVLKK